jgi:hypothetical protein
MKRTLPTAIAVAAAALTMAAPAAYGEGGLAGSSENGAVAYFHANELATTAAQGSTPPSEAVAFFRANELATAAAPSTSVLSRAYVDRDERGTGLAPASPGITQTAGASGSDPVVGWSHVAIGFGIGLVLTLGLLLTMRLRPRKPLAQ